MATLPVRIQEEDRIVLNVIYQQTEDFVSLAQTDITGFLLWIGWPKSGCYRVLPVSEDERIGYLTHTASNKEPQTHSTWRIEIEAYSNSCRTASRNGSNPRLVEDLSFFFRLPVAL